MRLGAIAFAFLMMTISAYAEGGPDSVRICTLTGCKYVDQARIQKFGTYTPKPQKTVVIDGKKFKPTPSVSYHSDATRWINAARADLGKTGRQFGAVHKRLWCGEAMGRWARSVGMKTPRNPNWAADWSEVGQRVSSPQVGAVALIGKSRIHHVGIVTGIDGHGNPIIISGNHNDRVVETAYPRGSIAAYIVPGA